MVPITQDQLVLGSCAIAASSGMVAEDVCLNFMPLFHVGGICRNLLAPLLRRRIDGGGGGFGVRFLVDGD